MPNGDDTQGWDPSQERSIEELLDTEIAGSPASESPDDSDSWAKVAEAVKGMNQATEDAKKTQQAVLLAGQMAVEQPAPAAQAQPTPPAPIRPPPAPRNRMYMGPNVGDPNASPQQFFQDAPPNILINRMPTPAPLSPPEQQAAQSRVAAATKPAPDPRLSMIGEDQYAAQQGYLNATRQGMEPAAAAQTWLPQMLRGQSQGRFVQPQTTPRPMTDFQRAEVERWKARDAQQKLSPAKEPTDIASRRSALNRAILALETKMASGQAASPNSRNPRVASSPEAKANKDLLDQWQKQLDGLGKSDTPTIKPPVAVTPPAGTATATAAPKSASQPMPKDKSGLVKGQVYKTRHGDYVWDGTKFVKQ
jgi:hypothetical protein